MIRADVLQLLRRLVGLRCWHVTYAEELCRGIGLSFGEKRQRRRPLLKSTPESVFGNYEGEFTLTIWCPWRVRCEADILMSAYGSTPDHIHHHEHQLTVECVQQVDLINEDTWDLALRFGNGLILESMSSLDRTHDNHFACDMSLRYDDRRLSMGPGTIYSDDLWS